MASATDSVRLWSYLAYKKTFIQTHGVEPVLNLNIFFF